MNLHVRHLGVQAYAECLSAMQAFTQARNKNQDDEIWMVQHPAIFTLGKAARPEHLLDAGDIPVFRSERGGQITYHGPGQVIAYVLLDLARRRLLVRELVFLLEQACIDVLTSWGLAAERKHGAPGVYLAAAQAQQGQSAAPGLTGLRKIAALGLKISRSCSYHGIALNVAMDLEPFGQIDPCGYPGLAVTDMKTSLGCAPDSQQIEAELAASLRACLEAHDLRQVAAP
jgi:lipoyl(octanoyl) transferase